MARSLTQTEIIQYGGEDQLPAIMALMALDLSEPYSIFTYRYFLTGWPGMCFMVRGHHALF